MGLLVTVWPTWGTNSLAYSLGVGSDFLCSRLSLASKVGNECLWIFTGKRVTKR